ncbi:MAG: hypothetical protein IID40_06080 [Planctomycetes bacterium]|nr:hypothetical protein [Planctomycetota bacterium]
MIVILFSLGCGPGTWAPVAGAELVTPPSRTWSRAKSAGHWMAIVPPVSLSSSTTAYTEGHYGRSHLAQESLDQHTHQNQRLGSLRETLSGWAFLGSVSDCPDHNFTFRAFLLRE